MQKSSILDPQLKETFVEVGERLTETLDGLLHKYFKRGKPCTRLKNIHQPPLNEEEKIIKLEKLIDDTAKRLEIEQEIRKILKEEENERKSGRPKKKKVEKDHFKKLCKCESRYDWSYVKNKVADNIQSPSAMSLEYAESYYVLPGTKSSTVLKNQSDDVLQLAEEFIQLPLINGKSSKKYRPTDKKEKLREKVAEIMVEFKKWKKKRARDYVKKAGKRRLQLYDRIQLGYVPDLCGRADLESLYRKIRPKRLSVSKDWFLRCYPCYMFEEPKPLTYHRSNTLRQELVLDKYTPKDHEKMTASNKRRRGFNRLTALNHEYYGTGPTLWKCKKVESFFSLGEIKEKYMIESCVRLEKPEKEEKIPELIHPTFINLTVDERNIIQYSWKNRGVNKVTLCMLWYSKIFKSNPEALLEQLPGQSVETMFLNQYNLDYIKKLSELLDLIVKQLHHTNICSKLIWEVGILHASLNLTKDYFETLKKTLLSSIKESFHPPLKQHQYKAWKKFIDIWIDITQDAYQWNKWPREFRKGTKQLMELRRSKESIISEIDPCSEDDLALLPEKMAEELEVTKKSEHGQVPDTDKRIPEKEVVIQSLPLVDTTELFHENDIEEYSEDEYQTLS